MLPYLTISGSTPWAEGRPPRVRAFVTDDTEIIGARSKREAMAYYKACDPQGFAELTSDDFDELDLSFRVSWGECGERDAERITMAEAIRRLTILGVKWPEQIATAYC